jgi:hypothetical protein
MMFFFFVGGFLFLWFLYGISRFILFCQGKTMTVDGRVVKRGEKKKQPPPATGMTAKDREIDIYPEEDDDIP